MMETSILSRIKVAKNMYSVHQVDFCARIEPSSLFFCCLACITRECFMLPQIRLSICSIGQKTPIFPIFFVNFRHFARSRQAQNRLLLIIYQLLSLLDHFLFRKKELFRFSATNTSFYTSTLKNTSFSPVFCQFSAFSQAWAGLYVKTFHHSSSNIYL